MVYFNYTIDSDSSNRTNRKQGTQQQKQLTSMWPNNDKPKRQKKKQQLQMTETSRNDK